MPPHKDFVARVRAEAVGEKVVKSVTPGQMVIKIVQDELVNVLKPAEGEATRLSTTHRRCPS